MRQPLLTKTELAQTLNVSTRTVDRWRSMGLELGEIDTGGYPRFDPVKVTQAIESGKITKRNKPKAKNIRPKLRNPFAGG